MTGIDGSDRQDIRLAVVMNGGVSLAVWIGGVSVELHHLAMARSWEQPVYDPLLDLLNADARVDVIAGTSAGGLNGAFLALGLAWERDIASVGDLWRDKGALGDLLRNPLHRNPPSLLKGSYFLDELRKALQHVKDSSPPKSASGGTADERPVELILTGTLWRGRQTSFCDDMGVRMTEVDHDARFTFATDGIGGPNATSLRDESVVDQLAVAARCSSSFPAAFEPHWVTVPQSSSGGDGPWPSTAGLANFRTSQYVVDGGVLLNKPIRPALEAIYRQTGQLQVRRILTYVVPDPGEAAPLPQIPDTAAPDSSNEPVPEAPEVLLGVLTRLRSTDSVSRELAEIRSRNEEVRLRRQARGRFASAMTKVAEPLSEAAWQGYLEVRVQHAAETIGRWLTTGQQADAASRWSEREIVACLRTLLWDRREQEDSFIPGGESAADAADRTNEEWDWGQTTVRRLFDMTTDVLKRAIWLAPMNSTHRSDILEQRQQASKVFKEIQANWEELGQQWSAAGATAPTRGDDGLGRATASSMQQLKKWLIGELDKWSNPPNAKTPDFAARRGQRFLQAERLAECLADCSKALHHIAENGNTIVDPDGIEKVRLQALTGYLLDPSGTVCSRIRPRIRRIRRIRSRMLLLDVVQLAYAGAHHEVEQEVELVQFSSNSPDLLTGKQLHHFGAFYRASWRVNDWIHGRMDGAAHLVRTLMSVERLRQVSASNDGKDKEATELLVVKIRKCAVDATEPVDRTWLEGRWDEEYANACSTFASRVVSGPESADTGTGTGTGTGNMESDPLGLCVEAVTRALQTHILRQDLHRLADAVRAEGDGRPTGSTAWLAEYDTENTTARTAQQPMGPAELWKLWNSARTIGSQRITQEVGGDLLANTAAHTAAVIANSVGPLSQVKAVGTVLGALRGYTLAVWAMIHFLTRPGSFGNRVVQLALATGGVLLAVSLVVPAMPVAFTLVGVLVLLAGWSAAALLTPDARRVGYRLAIAAGLAGIAVAGYAWWDLSRREDMTQALWSLAIKLGVGLLVVLLGWWVAGARESGFFGAFRLALRSWLSRRR
ncbi:patatin-like protein [Streptomyces sp. ISL-44]|uniref:patatin-like protein n=1 Tax=Streptomyces sp. ISL-44 TaxID=2819184 RepID=UPI001BE7C84D|nr:patatin-like protein [Streptomyces sp. ISL-44]MBT2543283.1 patatin-like protein [Streptomyces sp. ISL-44]